MKKFTILGATILFVGIFLTGCTTQGEEQKTENTQPVVNEEKQEPVKEQEETKEEKVFKTGETAEFEGLEITIKSAALKNGNKYIPPEKGKVLAVEFQVKNQREEQAYVGMEEFNLFGEDGNQLQSYFSYDDGFMKTNLKQGETKSGVMYFDVPEGDKYELVYKPNITDDQGVKFEITLQKE